MGCVGWLGNTDKHGTYARGGQEPGMVVGLGEQPQALLCGGLLRFWYCCIRGKFAADTVRWYSGFGGCFLLLGFGLF